MRSVREQKTGVDDVKNAQRLIAARSLRAQESSICGSFHLITSRPAAGKVDQGAAGSVEPGSGREFGSSLATGAGTGSLPLAPRSRQTCASLPHRVTHRCPWIARQKKNTHSEQKRSKYTHSRAVEKRQEGRGGRERAINANLALMKRISLRKARLDYYYVSDSIWVMLEVRRGAQTSPGRSCVCACLSASLAMGHRRNESDGRDADLGLLRSPQIGRKRRFSASLRRTIAACVLRNIA